MNREQSQVDKAATILLEIAAKIESLEGLPVDYSLARRLAEVSRDIRDSVNVPDSLSVPDTAAQGTKRCTLCGASRLFQNGRWTVCSFVECRDPFHDYNLEQNRGVPDTGTLPERDGMGNHLLDDDLWAMAQKCNLLSAELESLRKEKAGTQAAKREGAQIIGDLLIEQHELEKLPKDRLVAEVMRLRAAGTQAAEGLLVEALKKIATKQCSCMSSTDPDWHHETCFKFIANLALSTYKQGKTTKELYILTYQAEFVDSVSEEFAQKAEDQQQSIKGKTVREG